MSRMMGDVVIIIWRYSNFRHVPALFSYINVRKKKGGEADEYRGSESIGICDK